MNKFKFDIIYLTDTHWRENRPKARKDENYLNTILKDFKVVLDYANELESSELIMLHCGDVFETPSPSFKTYAQFARLISKFNGNMYVCPGQHDYFNHNLSTLRDSALSFISDSCENFRYLTNKAETISNTVFGNVDIHAFAYDEEIEIPVPNGNHKIFMFHKSVSYDDSSFTSFETIYNKIKSLYKKESVLMLFGDIHDFSMYEQRGNITIAATGAFCIKTIDDFERPMYAMHIRLTDKGFIRVNTIEVDVDEEVLDNGYKNNNIKENVRGFLASVERAKRDIEETLEEKVKRIGTASEYTDEVIELVLKTLNSCKNQ